MTVSSRHRLRRPLQFHPLNPFLTPSGSLRAQALNPATAYEWSISFSFFYPRFQFYLGSFFYPIISLLLEAQIHFSVRYFFPLLLGSIFLFDRPLPPPLGSIFLASTWSVINIVIEYFPRPEIIVRRTPLLFRPSPPFPSSFRFQW